MSIYIFILLYINLINFIFRDLAKKRNKKIKQYIKSFIIATLITGGLLGPILYALLKKSTFYVTHRVTQPSNFYFKKYFIVYHY